MSRSGDMQSVFSAALPRTNIVASAKRVAT